MGKEYALSFSVCLQYKVEVQLRLLTHKSSLQDSSHGSSFITQKYWIMRTDNIGSFLRTVLLYATRSKKDNIQFDLSDIKIILYPCCIYPEVYLHLFIL